MTPSLEEDFRFIFAKAGKAKGPASGAGRRSQVLQAIRGAPQVMFKITSFASSAEKLAKHLDYISRNGDNKVFDRDGNSFNSLATAETSPRDALQLYGRELAAASKMNTQTKGRKRSRVSMNCMLSMPAGTDKTAFELAVGDFLSREYAAYDYVYTFHDDRDHYHAHVVVGLRGNDGRWLNPRKQEILQWRESFAARLQARGIAATATPAYTRGKKKQGYRRDLAEVEKRGTRRAPRPAPSYDQAKEQGAIAERRQAWTRIAAHYSQAGDPELSEGITAFVAAHYSGQKSPEHSPEPGERRGRGR